MLSSSSALLLRSARALARVSAAPARGIAASRPLRDTFTIQDEDDFREKVLESAEPVVVDFKATWCGPCKLLTPRLEAAVAAAGGKVHLAVVDIDEMSELAVDHGVQAVPTVIAVRDGKTVDQFVGLIDEDKLGAFVERLAS